VAAAAAIRPTAKGLQAAVLAYIIGRGCEGATDEECQGALGLRVQTQTPRRGELVKSSFVRDSGRRRPTSSGRMATVWISSTCSPRVVEAI